MDERPPEEENTIQDISPIIENSEEILENKGDITEALNTNLKSGFKTSNFDSLFGTLRVALQSDLDDSEIGDTASVFLNICAQPGSGAIDEIEEETEGESEIAEFVRSCTIKYAKDLQKLSNVHYRGPESWTEIKTTKSIRSSRPMFQTEFIRCYDDRFNVASSPPGMVNIARHTIQQLLDAKNELGRDTFDYLQEDDVNDLFEIVEELRDEVEKYNEEYGEEDIESDTEREEDEEE